MNLTRIGFYFWILMVLTVLTSLLVTWQQGLVINTNLMALFPEAEQSVLQETASKRLAKTQGRRIALLISHPNSARLKYLAPIIETELFRTGLFSPDQRISQQSELAALYQSYRTQLFSREMKHQLETQPDITMMEGLNQFYNPFSGVSPQEYLSDPALSLRNFLLSHASADNLILEDGRLWSKGEDRIWLFIPLLLKGDPYHFQVQEELLSTINTLQLGHQELIISYTGTAFYAAFGANSARSEISTIGVGSVIGILLLIVWVFRSLVPLLLAAIAVTIGISAAALATHIVFGSIHIFTLVFGACLIGVSIDYAFHYFSHQFQGEKQWCAKHTINKIVPGISLGLISSVTAYTALSLAPFPGLRQVALFSSVGLTAAYLTVVLAFPVLSSLAGKTSRTVPWAQQGLIDFWRRFTLRQRFIGWGIASLVCIPLLMTQTSDDNVRNLQGLDSSLKIMEQQFQQVLGVGNSPRYLLIESEDAESLLRKEEDIHLQLANLDKNSALYGISQFVPSERTQRENYQLYQQEIVSRIHSFLLQAGFPEQTSIRKANELRTHTFQPLTIDTWLNSPASIPWQFLWIKKTQGKGVASIMLLNTQLNSNELRPLNGNHVQVVDPADDYSKLFSRYRQQIGWLLLLAYGVILALLCFRYSLPKAIAVISVPAGGCLLTLTVISALGIPLNLFHILALILVTGISIDYSVFFAETKTQPATTLLSIALASATTMLSFGLLGLSSTPAVSAVGITVCLGIVFAYILSPLAFIKKPTQKNDILNGPRDSKSVKSLY